MADHRSEGPTPVEQRALAASPFADLYPPLERIRTLTVDNFPALGRLAAMRFVEWVQAHPGGVVSLPTGRTPEHFITWVRRLLQGWERPQVQAELEAGGVDPAVRPDMTSLHFVQIDEFYPIEPSQQNSFFFYVNRLYVDGFGLDRSRALLMDCSQIGLLPGQTLSALWPDGDVDLSLRYRAARDGLERRQQEALLRIDQWCQDYEDRVRALGGIGFFMGGIGPDGHIGFNVRGSDHHSTTRLTEVNYETQAAAATDLGGIEVARRRLVITIGLGTIAANPQCCALILAAGEAKARVVADAVQQPAHVSYPATALHVLPNARFYVTAGAARLLRPRQVELVARAPELGDEQVERIVVDLAVGRGKRIVDLGEQDFRTDPFATALLARRPGELESLKAAVRQSLIARIERGSRTLTGTRFLHTEPHHDDLMLGYLPYIVRHVRDATNVHCFACLTGGFTAVTNSFVAAHLAALRRLVDTPSFAALFRQGYFDPGNENGRNRDVWQYLDGVAANDPQMQAEGAARRLLRNLITVFGEGEHEWVRKRIEILEEYFATRYPGQKDVQQVQQLKARCREWEAECLWGYFGWDCASVRHLRLGFYTGDIFTEEPTVERDVLPVLELVRQVQPDVVSVAFDPEASGPDTHYKVLQAVTEALRRYEAESGRSDLRVWGYRNVWFRFHPAEANVYVPVSLNMLSIMHSAFMNTFISQREASFPSHEHAGPFSELAQRIQVEQYQRIKTCLGRQWFHEHPSALIRATRGLVFLKDMSLTELYAHSRALRQAAENR
ncbi:MAG: glucosamine-6-phosphate deaminase [Candidatus Latescibacterota bacterium]